MSCDFKNPFAGFTQIVTGDRFIGRKEDISRMVSMLIRPEADEPISNVAIVGIHRIGKSSLVKHVLTANALDLFVKQRLPIWINLKDHRDSRTFFYHLVHASLKEIINAQYLDAAAVQHLSSYKPEETSFWIDFLGVIKDFFSEVCKAGIHILFILEEFDYARVLFAKDYQGFESLRQLSQDCGVNYVTLSRRTIKHIEIQTMAGSTLDGIFGKYYLAPFNDQDLREYFAVFSSLGVQINAKMEKQILSFCGGHPYLLAMLGCEILEISYQKREINIEQIINQIQLSCDHYFDNVIERLREDQNIDVLLKVIFGPKIDITQRDINELKSYGLIKVNPDQKSLQGTKLSPAYICFSRSFQEYLSDLGRKVEELYPLLGRTELALRTLISRELQKKHKGNWLEELKNHYPEEFRRYAQDQRTGRIGSSNNPLDYTYLRQLFEIIFEKYWDVFRPIFEKDKFYWKPRTELIIDVRNPVMHIRVQNITADVRSRLEEYCNEILKVVEEHIK